MRFQAAASRMPLGRRARGRTSRVWALAAIRSMRRIKPGANLRVQRRADSGYSGSLSVR
jgi:hypothetical protein